MKTKKKIWRNKVKNELKNAYKRIFKLIDKMIFLKVPSFKHVYKWRLTERKLKSLQKEKNNECTSS